MKRALLLLICPVTFATSSLAQVQSTPAGSTIKTDKRPSVAASRSNQSTKPLWSELSIAEQTALRPLAAKWDTMNVGQKRKWQSIALDFAKRPTAQQSQIHARMTEWAALSPQQRATARQNFAANRELTDGLTPEQRQVQWQAYQQLSPEEKRKLAESAPKAAAAGAAPAARPQPVLRKEPAPQFGSANALAKAKAAPKAPAPGKKIAVASHVLEQGSILPGSAKQAD